MCFNVHTFKSNALQFHFLSMKNFDITTGGNLPKYINLSNESAEEAIEASKLCESIRIKIENLTP